MAVLARLSSVNVLDGTHQSEMPVVTQPANSKKTVATRAITITNLTSACSNKSAADQDRYDDCRNDDDHDGKTREN